MSIENIARVEMLDCFVVVIHFVDGTKTEIIGNPEEGNALMVGFNGNRNQQAAKFLKEFTSKTDQHDPTFWWETLEIVEQFKVKIYEG